MGKKIQYSGLALIIIAAIVLIASYFNGWNNINAVNFGAFGAMIVGLIVYIYGGKKDLAEYSKSKEEQNGRPIERPFLLYYPATRSAG